AEPARAAAAERLVRHQPQAVGATCALRDRLPLGVPAAGAAVALEVDGAHAGHVRVAEVLTEAVLQLLADQLVLGVLVDAAAGAQEHTAQERTPQHPAPPLPSSVFATHG